MRPRSCLCSASPTSAQPRRLRHSQRFSMIVISSRSFRFPCVVWVQLGWRDSERAAHARLGARGGCRHPILAKHRSMEPAGQRAGCGVARRQCPLTVPGTPPHKPLLLLHVSIWSVVHAYGRHCTLISRCSRRCERWRRARRRGRGRQARQPMSPMRVRAHLRMVPRLYNPLRQR
jgi:hypothetical protein